MSDKLNKIKERILKLREMVPERGASEEEALAALVKAQELMLKYGLDEADLNVASVVNDMTLGEFKFNIKTRHPYSKFVSQYVAILCGVRSWFAPSIHSDKFFGFEGDVLMYEFLTMLIHDSMNRGWKNFVLTNPPRKSVTRHEEYWSFMYGFSEVIVSKIRELIKEQHDSEEMGTDVIVRKMDLVDEALQNKFPNLRLKKSRSKSVKIDNRSRGQGNDAGNTVNLQRPLQKHKTEGRKMIK